MHVLLAEIVFDVMNIGESEIKVKRHDPISQLIFLEASTPLLEALEEDGQA